MLFYSLILPCVRVHAKSVQLCPTLCDPIDCSPPGSSVHGISQARILGVGSHFLLQGIFLIQGSNLSLLHSGQSLYHLSHQGSPFFVMLECFSSTSFLNSVSSYFVYFCLFMFSLSTCVSILCYWFAVAILNIFSLLRSISLCHLCFLPVPRNP